jgi:biopolymer transport protein ExbB/TolQ
MDLREMLLQGWPILSVLLVMSVLSVAIIVDRNIALRRARIDAQAFIAEVIRILKTRSSDAALEHCRRFPQPIAVAAAAVLAQQGDRSSRERALQHVVQGQIRELESYVPILATIASSAPFVGLFGTVVGIIRAFSDIAKNLGGGPEVVAAGIAEALVATAAGLLVAIPALMGYNYFVRQIEREAEGMDLAVYDLIDAVCPEAVVSSSRN